MDGSQSMAFWGEVAAMGAACCWVVPSIAFARAGERVGSLSVNVIRLLFAVPLLSIATLLLRGQLLPTDAEPGTWLWLSSAGLIGHVFGDMCLFRAFVVIGPRLASLIMATSPLITAVIGYLLLGEQLGLRGVGGILLIGAGVTFGVLDRRPQAPLDRANLRFGILLGLGGALGQSLSLVVSKHGMGTFDPLAATQIRILAALAAWLLVIAALGRWPLVARALTDRAAVRLLVVGTFFGPFAAIGLSMVAVQQANTAVAASIMSTTPILLIPITVWMFGERVGWRGVVGTVVTVAGVTVLFLR